MRRIVILALLLMSSAAWADREVGIVVTGEATIQPQLAAEMELWLSKHGHQLVSSPLPPDAINTVIDCFVVDDEDCARGVVEKRSRSSSLVYAHADVQAGSTAMDHDVTLVAYWFEKGRKAVRQTVTCARCNEQTLKTTTDSLMAALANTGQKTGKLKCTSDPAGAEVTVDGKRIGATPVTHDLAPGSHRIVIAEETRDVVVKAGETTTLDIPLAVEGGGAPARPRKSRAVPVTVMTMGLAAMVTGGVLYAIDEDRSADQRFYNDTAPGGVALVTSGTMVFVAGFLWFRSAGKRSAPMAAASRDGAYFGWSGEF